MQSLPLESEATADLGRASMDNPSPRPAGRKRPASKELPDPPPPPTHRHVDREGGGSAGVDDFAESSESRQMAEAGSEELLAEVLSCEHLYSSRAEALMAAFLQKRMQKEIPPSGNHPELQARVDEAKRVAWDTVSGKQAVKVWTGAKAQDIKHKYSHRFVGSRFVITNKADEDGSRIKARICLQGHSDPDFDEKIKSGLCHSPTLSHLGRAVLLQILVSSHWTLNLGDIKGAFLEAGELPSKFRPLYARQPQGGFSGISPEAVMEVTGYLYGANDAPYQWYNTFDQAAREVGFSKRVSW